MSALGGSHYAIIVSRCDECVKNVSPFWARIAYNSIKCPNHVVLYIVWCCASNCVIYSAPYCASLRLPRTHALSYRNIESIQLFFLRFAMKAKQRGNVPEEIKLKAIAFSRSSNSAQNLIHNVFRYRPHVAHHGICFTNLAIFTNVSSPIVSTAHTLHINYLLSIRETYLIIKYTFNEHIKQTLFVQTSTYDVRPHSRMSILYLYS